MATRTSLMIISLVGLGLAPAYSQIGGEPGAFSRMGFGARGMAMGNAMTAVMSGDVASYYNPALLPYAGYRQVAASFGILSLDRSLNFLQFSLPLPPAAGVAFGVINAGVSKIDGRDADGVPTGLLRTTESQVFLGFAARVKAGFSLGINLKLYYYHLYTDINSVSVGIDAGFLLPVGESVSIGATVRDINSKYKWDTGTIFGQNGQTSQDRFPLLYAAGAAWMLPDSLGLLTVEVEFSNARTIIARAGAEVPLLPELTLRAGVDRVDIKEQGNGVRPALGFGARKELPGWTPALNYAYVLEPFAPSGLHMISLSVVF